MSFLTDPTFAAFSSLISMLVTIIAFYLTYLTFINPISRYFSLLSKPDRWVRITGGHQMINTFRHQIYSQYSIEIDNEDRIAEHFYEAWMDEILIPDQTHNSSYYVRVNCNGSLLATELFVSLDGHRYFVPVPRVRMVQGKPRYFIEPHQLQLSKIVGRFYHNETPIGFWSRSSLVRLTQPRTLWHRVKLVLGTVPMGN